MPGEIFRASYKFGVTVPVINVFVGAEVDIFQETGQNAPQGGPDLKAQLAAEAGPIKVPAVTVGPPLSNATTETVKIYSVPVPIPFVKSIDIDLVFNIVDYMWTPAAGNANDGVVTFGIVTKLQFVILGKNIDIQLAPPLKVSITLTDGTAASDAMLSATSQAPILAGLDLLQRLSA
jgi:hypothetical protein